MSANVSESDERAIDRQASISQFSTISSRNSPRSWSMLQSASVKRHDWLTHVQAAVTKEKLPLVYPRPDLTEEAKRAAEDIEEIKRNNEERLVKSSAEAEETDAEELPYTVAPPCFYDEDERVRTLERLSVLDTASESSFDNLVQLAAKLCDVPIALVSLVDKKRQWFKAKVGLDASETPRSVSFCGHAIADRNGALFEVPDAHEDLRFKHNPLVINDPSVRFYAGMPLHATNGAPLGTLCVIDRVPRKLSPSQREVLVLLAKQVEAELELRRVITLAVAQNELTELLLCSALPKHIIDELKTTKTLPLAALHEDVSVLFLDIVGFTAFSAEAPPAELLGALSDLFNAFDFVTTQAGLLKVKTIGDGYMVASGVPEWRADHAAAAVHVGRVYLAAIEQYNKLCGTSFQARIGINSGPVIAGVLGTSSLTYDLWGDTVNTAARHESASKPGRICVSQTTRQSILDNAEGECDLQFEDRGLHNLKGKGEMRIFYIDCEPLTSEEWEGFDFEPRDPTAVQEEEPLMRAFSATQNVARVTVPEVPAADQRRRASTPHMLPTPSPRRRRRRSKEVSASSGLTIVSSASSPDDEAHSKRMTARRLTRIKKNSHRRTKSALVDDILRLPRPDSDLKSSVSSPSPVAKINTVSITPRRPRARRRATVGALRSTSKGDDSNDRRKSRSNNNQTLVEEANDRRKSRTNKDQTLVEEAKGRRMSRHNNGTSLVEEAKGRRMSRHNNGTSFVAEAKARRMSRHKGESLVDEAKRHNAHHSE